MQKFDIINESENLILGVIYPVQNCDTTVFNTIHAFV